MRHIRNIEKIECFGETFDLILNPAIILKILCAKKMTPINGNPKVNSKLHPIETHLISAFSPPEFRTTPKLSPVLQEK